MLQRRKIKTYKKTSSFEETGNLPEKELRVMILKRIQDLKKRIEARIEKI